ncbi:MAG: superfamily II helicase [Satyrvirus sp.]|uniref:Superfamily II helicase n=1 Tax=Satyrvirus sp. TaxID=2487771 RepID=A0A3G5AHK2_9VIRU|nr:MAG: superfamily II helicase [Satyrvirus sp.]
MSALNKLKVFLEKHKSKAEYTHTAIDGNNGGKWNISNDKREYFFILYSKAALEKGSKLYYTEKHMPNVGPIIIDLDFEFSKKDPRVINEKIVYRIIKDLTKILKEMFGEGVNYECFVLQRPETYEKIKNGKELWSDGLHIHFPHVVCNYMYQLSLREKFMKIHKLEIQCENTIDKIYDKSVIVNSPWCLYLSTKPNKKPYEVKWILNSKRKPEDFTVLELVKILSIRNKSSESLEPINDDIVCKFVGKFVKKITVNEKVNSEPLKITIDQEYDEQIIRKLLNILKMKRVQNYHPWIKIILILYYCYHTDVKKEIDYLSIAHKWSKKSPENYNKEELDSFWGNLHKFLNKDKYLTIKTLHYYAKLDNPEEYKKLRVEMYLKMRKDSFPDNKLSINKVIFKPDVCIIELDDNHCPFSKHESERIFIEVTSYGLSLRCVKCLSDKITVNVSNNALVKIFNLKVPEINVEMLDDKEDVQILDDKKDIQIKKKSFKSADEILLMDENKLLIEETKLIEKEKYISEGMINEFKKRDTIIIHSPTGTGKTTAITKLLTDINEKGKILSVISRKSMSSLHKEYFKSIGITSYLDKLNKINKNRYITSMEQLYKVDSDYDILILDETTSLLVHFYSPTMKHSRLRSFVKLVDLLYKCKKVIVSDAIITDMVLDFVSTLRQNNEIVYYKNTFKNKIGINMHIYNRVNNSINKEIEIFCKPIIEKVKNKQPILIMSDSKSIVNNIYNYLLKYNKDKYYFRVYTKDSGILEEIENCNKIWKNKCILFSPKIIYGIDVLIDYDDVYAIYKGNTIDSFSMLQQISRTRNAKNVHVLFLTKHYKDSANRYISYKQNKYIEELELQKFLNNVNIKYGQDKINRTKKDVLDELKCLVINGKSGKMISEINENSLFGRIHLYASWYKRLFDYNKSQLFIKLCKHQGYTIIKHVFEQDNKATIFVNIKEKIINEIINQTDKIASKLKEKINKESDEETDEESEEETKEKTNDLIDIENRKQIIKENLKNRMNYLKVSNERLIKDEQLKKIIIDEDKYIKCTSSIMLYYNKQNIDKEELKSCVENFSFIEKSKRLFKILSLVEWLEKELNVNRFKICDLKIKDINMFKDKLLKEINQFQWLSFQNGENARKNEIKLRIAKLNSEDRVKKFFMDIVNQFDDFYGYVVKKIGKKKISTYIDFKFNREIMNDHIKIINCLNMDPEKFINEIKDKINKKQLIDMIDINDF